MPNNPQEAVTEVVTQVDMELADAIADLLKKRGLARILVAGNVDLIMLLARHRRLATEAVEAECARLREALATIREKAGYARILFDPEDAVDALLAEIIKTVIAALTKGAA